MNLRTNGLLDITIVFQVRKKYGIGRNQEGEDIFWSQEVHVIDDSAINFNLGVVKSVREIERRLLISVFFTKEEKIREGIAAVLNMLYKLLCTLL